LFEPNHLGSVLWHMRRYFTLLGSFYLRVLCKAELHGIKVGKIKLLSLASSKYNNDSLDLMFTLKYHSCKNDS